MTRTGGTRGATGALAVILLLAMIGCASKVTQPVFRKPVPSAGLKPDSPANVLRLLEWSYNNRAIDVYRDLFTADFEFHFSPVDSAGAEYRGTPWTREDEMIYARQLFLGGGPEPPADSISLTLDRNFLVFPDPRTASFDPTGIRHRTIRTQVLLTIVTVDRVVDISGAAIFYFVRGDSALIPEEMLQRGIGPDSTRWYIQRWDDETVQAGPSPGLRTTDVRLARSGSILASRASSHRTWGSLKALYR